MTTQSDSNDLTVRFQQLRELSKAYYEGNPLASDDEFDSLLEEYKRLGGTEIVGHGFVPEASRKVAHSVRMLSLDKERSLNGLRKWMKRCQQVWETQCDSNVPLVFTVSPKFDGLAVAVTISNGRITRIATRGDGQVGEEVTKTALAARNLPDPSQGEANRIEFGEVLLPKEELAAVNALRDPKEAPLTQVRNAAAGLVRRLDDTSKSAKHLLFANHNSGAYITSLSFQQLDESLEKLLEGFEPQRTHYEVAPQQHIFIDGVVFKVENPDVREAMGESQKAPRWAIAFKYADDTHFSTITGVDWGSPGKTGRITPVIEYDAIDIDGGRYIRATAHNLTKFLEFSPAVGDGIEVSKAGDIIPFVVEVANAGGEPIPFPRECPKCGAATVVDGEFLVCSAPREDCDPVRSLTLVISSLGVKGVQEKVLRKIHEVFLKDCVNAYDSLTKLRKLPDGAIAGVPGLGETMENKIRGLLDEGVRNARLAFWLRGLNVPRVGSTVSRELEKTYGNIDDILNAIDDPSAYVEAQQLKGVNWESICAHRDRFVLLRDWLQSEDIHPVVEGFGNAKTAGSVESAGSVSEVSNSAENYDNSLVAAGDDEGASDNRWRGKKVVLTGALPISRAEASEWLERQGATVASSFSNTIDILIDAGSGNSSKSKKARAAGKVVVSGEEFMEDFESKTTLIGEENMYWSEQYHYEILEFLADEGFLCEEVDEEFFDLVVYEEKTPFTYELEPLDYKHYDRQQEDTCRLLPGLDDASDFLEAEVMTFVSGVEGTVAKTYIVGNDFRCACGFYEGYGLYWEGDLDELKQGVMKRLGK